MTVSEHLAAKESSDQTPDSQTQDAGDVFMQQPIVLSQVFKKLLAYLF